MTDLKEGVFPKDNRKGRNSHRVKPGATEKMDPGAALKEQNPGLIPSGTAPNPAIRISQYVPQRKALPRTPLLHTPTLPLFKGQL